jgi:hypothetical protein
MTAMIRRKFQALLAAAARLLGFKPKAEDGFANLDDLVDWCVDGNRGYDAEWIERLVRASLKDPSDKAPFHPARYADEPIVPREGRP